MLVHILQARERECATGDETKQCSVRSLERKSGVIPWNGLNGARDKLVHRIKSNSKRANESGSDESDLRNRIGK